MDDIYKELLESDHKMLANPKNFGQEVDYQIANATDCPECGEVCRWAGFVKGGKYRALIVCPKCKFAQEI